MEYIFETEHLRGRKFCPEDAEPLFEICNEDEVKKWFPNESFADMDEAKDDPYGNGMLVYKKDTVC